MAQQHETCNCINEHTLAMLQSFDERGSNLFISEERMVMFKKLGENSFFQFGFSPENYPAVEAGILELTEEEVITHIECNLGGWFARKCQLDVALDSDGHVIQTEE